MLADKVFRDNFLHDNSIALATAYDFVAEWMSFHHLESVFKKMLVNVKGDAHFARRRIRFTRANGGVYILVDLDPFLSRLVGPSASTREKLDAGVAAMLKEKVFLVSLLKIKGTRIIIYTRRNQPI